MTAKGVYATAKILIFQQITTFIKRTSTIT